MNSHRIKKLLSITIGVAGIIFAIVYFIGVWENHSDPIGEDNSNCIKTPLAEVSNGVELIVSSYNTTCDVFGGNSAMYVHVHKKGAAEERRTLVFRYFDRTDAPQPKLKWTARDHLFIEVGDVVQITKKIEVFNGIQISYQVGREKFPPQNDATRNK